MAKNAIQINPDQVIEIQSNLLNWYQENKRDLPWRKSKDPYKVWVSEIMLQQTKVATVIPYYDRFMETFPTLQDLADADEQKVLKMWEGLGYYSRARNLHRAVKEVRDVYHGKVPDEPEQFGKLRGVGPYTKGAVLSIAFNKKIPAVDGNVMRVFSRWFTIYDDIARSKTRKKMEQYAMELIPEKAPGDFNQALMDLGATICTPTSPSCLFCPVQQSCQAFHEGVQDELPVKKKEKAPTPRDILFLAIEIEDGLLLEKRPNRGLLAGLWSLPTIEWNPNEDMKVKVEEYCRVFQTPFAIREIGNLEHVFSHRHWKIKLLVVDLFEKPTSLPKNSGNYLICSYKQLDRIAFANVYRKAIDQWKKWRTSREIR